MLVGASRGQVTTAADGLAGLGANGPLPRRRPWATCAPRWPSTGPTASPQLDRRADGGDRRGGPAARPGPGRVARRRRPQPAPGAAHPGRQPVHADRRHRRGAVHGRQPDAGTAAASPSASSTPASTSHTRRCRRPRTGERKIVDWVTATAPDRPTTTRPGSAWRTNVTGPTFTVDGAHLDRAGLAARYRFGVFNERDAAPRRRGRQRRQPGRQPGRQQRPLRRAVGRRQHRLGRHQPERLLRRRDRDDRLQGPLRRRHLRHRQPGDRVAESMPFVVQTDGKGKFVNIGIVSGAHGSHVAGITAGNGLFGGAMSGAAPGAKLVSVRVCLFVAGCTSHALIEGMIYAAKQANVDVINMSIGGLPSLNDGNNTRARALQPADRPVQRADVHLGRQQRPGHQHRSATRRWRTKVMSVGVVHHRRDLAGQLRLRARRTPTTCTTSARAARARTAASSPTSSRRARPSRPSRPGSRAARSPARTRCRRATRCSTAPRWPRRRRRARRRCWSAPRRRSGVQRQPAQLRQAMNSSARFIDRLPARTSRATA